MTLDKWFRETSIPVIPKPRTVKYEHLSFVQLFAPPSGNFTYIGDVSLKLTPESIIAAALSYVGNLSLTLTPESGIDPHHNYTGALTLSLTPDSVTTFNTGKAYSVMASVFITGADYSKVLIGEVNVTREDNAAATFSITVKDSTKKAAEFLNREIKIAFQVADNQADVVAYVPIFTGQIKRAAFNEREPNIFTLTGYDYGGIHGTPGEYISSDITDVITGSVFISGSGTFSTGFAPIWGVTYSGTGDIEDGRDYFVNTLTGEIIVPLSSNFNNTPGGLSFSYSTYFDTLKKLMENIADTKGWNLLEDGVTLVDYSAKSKQPVLSLSNESVIDIIRKFLEMSGAKCETNLFPVMRIYSETTNLTGADNHILDETIIYEDSLNIDISLDELITQQKVRSVAKTLANIEIGAGEEIASRSGSVAAEIIFDAISWSFVLPEWIVPKIIVEVKVPKTNIFGVTHVAGGTLSAFGVTENIQNSQWTQTIEANDIVYRLSIMPFVNILFARIIVAYPKADWTLVVNGTKIKYGEGVIEATVEVTGARAVTGISDTLSGDMYEHPYVETAAHAGNIANAILTELGNVYSMSCEIPIHTAGAMEIGDKINVKRGVDTIFKGIIKTLDYSLNTETAESPVGIEAKGVGFGI